MSRSSVASGSVASELSVGPRWATSATSTATLVGTLDAHFPAVVDDAGLVSPVGAEWALDWWIGADDRWYFPSEEPTVRQRRIGPGPVLETSMRIPSGDAVSTVYGSRSAAGNGAPADAIVVEIGNRSPVPVAVVLAIRPYGAERSVDAADLSDRQSSLSIKQTSPTTISINGITMLLPRAASGSLSSTASDVAETIKQGMELEGLKPVSGGHATAAVMFPLPHATTLRFVLADVAMDVDQLPDAERVARGWTSVVDGGARFSTPDDGVDQLLAAARARLLMEASDDIDDIGHVALAGSRPGPTRLLGRIRGQSASNDLQCDSGAGDIVAGLGIGGHWNGVEQALSQLADTNGFRCSSTAAGSRLVAGSAHAATLWLVDDPDRAGPWAERLLEPLTGLTAQVAKLAGTKQSDGQGTSDSNVAFGGLAMLCEALGQQEASTDLRSRVDGWQASNDAAIMIWHCPELAHLVELGQNASEAFSWPDPDVACPLGDGTAGSDSAAGAARYANAARHLLIAEDLAGTIELLPSFPTAWRGGAVEVHQAPTLYGRLSFAIRWHGARPALLWELTGGEAREITFRCPSLDPDWRSTASSGETLLAGSQAGLAEVPGPGDSFS